MTETPHPLYSKHADTLNRALTAISERAYWSAYPESPSPRVYGEDAAARGEAEFRAYLGNRFPLDQPGTRDWVSTERSPFGVDLDVEYPHGDPEALLAAAAEALPAWRDAGPQTRVGVCLEILARLHAHIFELANAVQFTTGQAFVMAFQAGGAHALDRALEAIAYAYAEMTRHPASASWEKPAGKGDPLIEPPTRQDTAAAFSRSAVLIHSRITSDALSSTGSFRPMNRDAAGTLSVRPPVNRRSRRRNGPITTRVIKLVIRFHHTLSQRLAQTPARFSDAAENGPCVMRKSSSSKRL
jgi:hypothetical protein